ncbi:MAG TPA: ThuA domain-containing protein [Candidatus Ruania gallistercoris]|uniref:ThuA domain-containing protein n=1 Tax=Candidatus Ruania gallistercoris TaxID=2838746 RepID=A0A9D2J375_9MICO|nr:ThuA domain-containing protein [Candidatus Ruania gallistercoris]
MTAVVLSGAGRYADPWHDFAGTSARLAEELTALGLSAEVATLGEAEVPTGTVHLLVVNAGGGSTPRPVTDSAADQRAEAVAAWARTAVAGGVPVLVTHTGSNTFYDDDRWADLIGGRWIPGVSWHPPQEETTVQVSDPRHPITAGLSELAVTDERYCDLEVHPGNAVLVDHAEDGRRHPIVWARETGGVRVVHDALGHDPAAYDGADRRALLGREVDWLLDRG